MLFAVVALTVVFGSTRASAQVVTDDAPDVRDTALEPVVIGNLHGVTIAKSCISPRKVGETTDCQIILGYDDDFDDTIMIIEAFDVIDPLGAATRVPDVGDLEIIAADGNTTAVVGGTLPVLIGPAGSTLAGLPGIGKPGVVTFRQNTYVITENDPDPLPSQAQVVVMDLCDAPGTVGCSEIENTVQFVAQTNVLNPQITLDVTANPSTICQGAPATSVEYTYVLTPGVNGEPLVNVMLNDPNCLDLVGPMGDVDGDNRMDVAEEFIDLNGNMVWDVGEPIINDDGDGTHDAVDEVWTYTCTALRTDTITSMVTASGGALDGPTCIATAEATVTVTGIPRPVAAPVNVEVCEGESGQLCANPTGGTAPYTFSWTGPGGFTATTECITVDVAGTYCVTVTDSSGCMSAEACADLIINPLPPCSINATTPVCVGAQGTATAPAGFTYAWQVLGGCGTIVGPADQSSVTIQYTVEGPCTLQLTLTNPITGCTSMCTTVVDVVPNPAANPADVTICEGETGTLCADATGGLAPYTFAWTGPGGFVATTECVTVGVAGDYCVVVTDANGCVSPQACGTLTVDPLPPCTITPPSTICAGTSGVFAGPAGPGLTYQWSTDCGTINGSATGSSVTIDFGAAGACTVTLTTTDIATGCMSTCNVPVIINANPIANPPNIVVCDGDTGQLCANPSGGLAPYTYAWTGPGGFTAATECITVGDAGAYCVIVTDANGCVSASTCGTVTIETLPPCTITPPPTICAGTPGVFMGSPGAGITYQWSTTCGTIVGLGTDANVTINFGAPGPCVVTLTTMRDGCTSTCDIPITVNENPVANPPNVAVCEGMSGELCANASGGLAPYTYAWTGPGGFTAATECVTVDEAGSYCVIVTDANGCVSAQACGMLTVNPLPPCTITSQSSTCAGSVATFAGPAGPGLGYQWSTDCGVIVGSSTNATVLIDLGAAGACTVTLTTTDLASNCTMTCTLPVTINANPVAAPVDIEFCEGDTGQVCANASGGLPPYTYAWTGPGGFLANTECITVGVGGTYCVTVTDANGCVSAPGCAAVTVDPLPACTIIPPSTICMNSAGTFSGPAGDLTYLWSTDCGTIMGLPTTQSVMIDFGPAGPCTVTLTTTDVATGCERTCSIQVTVGSVPQAAPDTLTICPGEDATICANASGGTPPYQYDWSTGETTPCINRGNPGSYTVMVTDANGCTTMGSGSLTIRDAPTVSLDGASICAGESHTFCPTIMGGVPPYEYQWLSGPTTPCITPMNEGSYCVTVIDANGCIGMACATLEISPRPVIDLNDITVCISELPVQLCASVFSGTAPYTLNWSTGDTTPCIEVAAAGTYTLTVIDAEGCANVASSVVTVQPDAFCNADEPGWNWYNNKTTLTGDQPTYWSVYTGLPGAGGFAPFTILDAGFPPGRPAMDGTNDRVLRGYVLGWAIRTNEADEIRWNHLTGTATIVNYRDGYAWEYGTYNYPVVAPVGQGQPTDAFPGVLRLDGQEYAQSPAMLLFNFQAVGSEAFSGPRQVTSTSDLTLHPVSSDLRQETDGPVTTKANFSVWNANEVKFSGAHRCITCWEQSLLNVYDESIFTVDALQTDHGKARVEGLESQVCDVDVDPTDGPLGINPNDVISEDVPLLGVISRLLTFDAGGADIAAHGNNLTGMGYDPTGVIEYDITNPTQESPAGPVPARASASEKGSLVVFSNVELRWDSNGILIQDTFLSMSNDFPEDVRLQFYFVNGDPEVIGTTPQQGETVPDEHFDALAAGILAGAPEDVIGELVDDLVEALVGPGGP